MPAEETPVTRNIFKLETLMHNTICQYVPFVQAVQ